jgi:Histidine kinase
MKPISPASTHALRAAPSLEAEKTKIARAIHDSVTQELSVIIWQLTLACAQHSAAQERTSLKMVLHSAESCMARLRSLMHDLRSNGVPEGRGVRYCPPGRGAATSSPPSLRGTRTGPAPGVQSSQSAVR